MAPNTGAQRTAAIQVTDSNTAVADTVITITQSAPESLLPLRLILHSMRPTSSIAGVARRVAMVSAPLALIAFSFLHGSFSWAETQHLHSASNEEWIQHLSTIKDRWLAIHLAGAFLFPLLGLTVWWMLPPRGLTTRISQAALVIYMPLYIAVDAVLGIGSAILIRYRDGLAPGERAGAEGALGAIFFEPSAIDWFDYGASLAWRIGLVAAAIAVWRTSGWRVSLPLLVAGWALSKSHFPPMGEVAGLALLVAAWMHLRTERREQPRWDLNTETRRHEAMALGSDQGVP